ncbi:MAG: hydrogenase iron-sulfur subunit [Caldisericia bacterium]|nr:hydrogenase iron-sulfur subunit [Caldisericia bacterium]MDD4614352.1 hydrogenase iron-sulfur subunit [Caldisericia bacterium]
MANKELIYLFPCLAEQRKKVLQEIQKKYPLVQVVPITCAGRFNTSVALKLIHEGAKGVIVLGCEPGDCHYREGSAISERRFLLTKYTLKAFGIEEDRFQALWHKPSDVKKTMADIDLFIERISTFDTKGGSNEKAN